ncbi:MAG: translation initiation factor IF-2 subunit gamma [Candidatus Anstonellales archaeon]
MQSEINVGILGHVDHGKTTLVEALTGKWTDTHSEEMKRGISIKLGYATFESHYCEACNAWSVKPKCPKCKKKLEPKRRISLLDSPGHEALMTTAISGSALMDGVLFLISANEKCPQPQTIEHMLILKVMGIRNVVVVQTKLDLVSKERAYESYREIKNFLSENGVDAPIVPVAAIHKINIDKLVEAIESNIKTPKRDINAPPKMFIVRSFDVNKPGTPPEKLVGGVIGGSLARGVLRKGDIVKSSGHIVKRFRITSLAEENERLEEATPGGLIAVGTELDPAITKKDKMVGIVIGRDGEIEDPVDLLKVKVHMLDRKDFENKGLTPSEQVVVSVNTATTIGFVDKIKKHSAEIRLKYPVWVEKGNKVAISRKIGHMWRLSAYAVVE